MDEFKTRASTHEKDAVLKRNASIEPRGANKLVDRVMPSDILSDRKKITVCVEQRGGVQPTGVCKDILRPF